MKSQNRTLIIMMQLADLQNFKTKKCQLTHQQNSLSSLHLNCSNYHSRQDKRRNPFAAGKSALVYSEIYVEDFYSTQMASNLVEYLFHPSIYKTILCKDRFKTNFEEGQDAPQCKKKWCPYIHAAQDLSSLADIRNLTLLVSLQDNFCQKLQPCSSLVSVLKGELTNESFNEQIRSFKEHLKEISNQTVEKLKIQQPEPPLLIPPPINKNTQILKAVQAKEHANWYSEYQYFHFGERLPIIQDRHHQFKNYRDIVTKDIAPIVVKYVAAFLNSDGGVLYVGVDDNSVVYGFQLTQHEFDRFLLNVDQEGKRSMLPPLLPHKYSIRRIPVYNNKKGKELWVVEIKVTPTEKHKKEKVLTSYNREVFIRMNASTQKLDAVDLIQYIRYHQDQKQEQRKPLEIAQQLGKNLELKDKSLNHQELLEIRQKLAKGIEKVEELLSSRLKLE